MQGYARKNCLCRDGSDAELVDSRAADAVDMLGSQMVVVGQFLGTEGLVSEHDIVLIAKDIAFTVRELRIANQLMHLHLDRVERMVIELMATLAHLIERVEVDCIFAIARLAHYTLGITH